MLVARSRKSYLGPAEIASFVSLVLCKNGGCRVSRDFVFFFLMLIKEMRRWGEFTISLLDPRDG